MRADIAALDLPDPMHPKPWEEKDESPSSEVADEEGGVASEVVPARFVFRDGWLQVQDTRTGEVVPRHLDFHRRLEQEHEARVRSEAENERLRAENERLCRERDAE